MLKHNTKHIQFILVKFWSKILPIFYVHNTPGTVSDSAIKLYLYIFCIKVHGDIISPIGISEIVKGDASHGFQIPVGRSMGCWYETVLPLS